MHKTAHVESRLMVAAGAGGAGRAWEDYQQSACGVRFGGEDYIITTS
jgi:hypothetical protein